MKLIRGQNLIGPEAVCRAVMNDLVQNGFTAIGVDRVAGSGLSPTTKAACLEAGLAVDGLSAVQKWCVILEANDELRTMTVNVLPSIQVTSDFRSSQRTGNTEVGRVSNGAKADAYFFNMSLDWGISPASDLTATPLAYDLSITNHGIALCVYAEGYGNTGQAFSWFVAQRGVTDTDLIEGDSSPLFCVFSIAGGQRGNPDMLLHDSIQRFTVVEKDIYSASQPISAVVPTPDGYPIINPLQQVSLFEGNKACILFPQLINTHRYLYFVKLDMLAYTSADVLSQDSQIEIISNLKRIQYKAQCANGRDNRGLRILFPEKVVGV